MSRTEKIAVYGVMASIAMVFGYVENLLPPLLPVPGMKLGISNVVVVISMYLFSAPAAIIINIIRILLSGLLFGHGVSLAYSLAGGVLSVLVMSILYISGKFGMQAVSMVGGVMHNVGQILVAIIIVGTDKLLYYLLILWLTGLVTGLMVGVISRLVCQYLPKKLIEKLKRDL